MSLAVDVVIDNYQYGRYLARAIDSALDQEHRPLRVIVVDDGSTDESHDVIASYDDRIEAVLKPNGGQASAVNAGFERCEGDVVIFLDADDILLPGAVGRVAAAFAREPGLAKVQHRMVVIDADGVPTGETKPDPRLPVPGGDMRRAELLAPFDIPWLPMSGNAFAAPVLRRILPMPEAGFRLCADYYLQHLTPLHGDVRSLAEAGAAYRVHGRNGYQPATAQLDLHHVRETIRYSAATRACLTREADELGLDRPAEILSVADLANRLISVRLEPGSHPLQGDRRGSIVVGALRALRRREDLAVPTRVLFALWFVCTAVLPRGSARALSEQFLFPERRAAINALVSWLQRRTSEAPAR